jgi:hypothetical protein
LLVEFRAKCAALEAEWASLCAGAVPDAMEACTAVRRIVTRSGIASYLHGSGARRGQTSAREDTSDEEVLPRGYILDFGVRKLMLALIHRGCLRVDWSCVTMAMLQQMTADSNEYMNSLPATWTAATLSSFLFGRTDWGLYASMWACLFGDLASNGRTRRPAQELSRLLERAMQGKYLDDVAAYVEEHGVVPCPALAFAA